MRPEIQKSRARFKEGKSAYFCNFSAKIIVNREFSHFVDEKLIFSIILIFWILKELYNYGIGVKIGPSICTGRPQVWKSSATAILKFGTYASRKNAYKFHHLLKNLRKGKWNVSFF
jgi:hypothetical protein